MTAPAIDPGTEIGNALATLLKVVLANPDQARAALLALTETTQVDAKAPPEQGEVEQEFSDATE